MEESGPDESGLIDMTRREIETFVSSLDVDSMDGSTTAICGQDCGSTCWCCEPLARISSFDSILAYAAGAFPDPADNEDDEVDESEIAEAKRTTLINLLAELVTKATAINVHRRFMGCMGPLRTQRIMESEPSNGEIATSLEAMLEPIVEAIFSFGQKTPDPASVSSSKDDDDDEPPAKRACVADEKENKI